MASGDALSTAKAKGLTLQGVGYKLLDGASAVLDGPWCDVRALRAGSVEIFGTFVGTVTLRGSNSDIAPSSGYEGSIIGSALTAPALVSIGMPIRWIKADVTAYTSGNISVFFHSTT